MTLTVSILPSPLLPASAYDRLDASLRAAGADAFVADPRLSESQGPDDLVMRWARDVGEVDLLIAHSNAGLLAPLMRADAAIVFMDAALPPESGDASLAPAALRDTLAELADEHGILPPWTRWWPPDTLREVIPVELVDAIDDACPRLPLDYFDRRIRAPRGWAGGANAYLAFGDTYEHELAFARAHAWPIRRLAGGHLHFLHEPAAVTDAALALVEQLT